MNELGDADSAVFVLPAKQDVLNVQISSNSTFLAAYPPPFLELIKLEAMNLSLAFPANTPA